MLARSVHWLFGRDRIIKGSVGAIEGSHTPRSDHLHTLGTTSLLIIRLEPCAARGARNQAVRRRKDSLQIPMDLLRHTFTGSQPLGCSKPVSFPVVTRSDFSQPSHQRRLAKNRASNDLRKQDDARLKHNLRDYNKTACGISRIEIPQVPDKL